MSYSSERVSFLPLFGCLRLRPAAKTEAEAYGSLRILPREVRDMIWALVFEPDEKFPRIYDTTCEKVVYTRRRVAVTEDGVWIRTPDLMLTSITIRNEVFERAYWQNIWFDMSGWGQPHSPFIVDTFLRQYGPSLSRLSHNFHICVPIELAPADYSQRDMMEAFNPYGTKLYLKVLQGIPDYILRYARLMVRLDPFDLQFGKMKVAAEQIKFPQSLELSYIRIDYKHGELPLVTLEDPLEDGPIREDTHSANEGADRVMADTLACNEDVVIATDLATTQQGVPCEIFNTRRFETDSYVRVFLNLDPLPVPNQMVLDFLTEEGFEDLVIAEEDDLRWEKFISKKHTRWPSKDVYPPGEEEHGSEMEGEESYDEHESSGDDDDYDDDDGDASVGEEESETSDEEMQDNAEEGNVLDRWTPTDTDDHMALANYHQWM